MPTLIAESLAARALKVLPNGMFGHQSVAMMPAGAPQFFARAEGAHLWDADGRRYIDWMCGYGPNLFGYADAEIDAAYVAQLKAGDAMTGPSPLIVELAEAFAAMIGHAEWALPCKNGTDATTVAVMAARAATGRKPVLRATGAYHGSQPWCTPNPAGALAEDRAHHHFFTWNDTASLDAACLAAGGEPAAILVSAFKHDAFQNQALPDPAFATACRALADKTGAMLILDDVRAGFRIDRESSWAHLGVEPDMSAWGKAIANGHALSIVLGNARARAGAEKIYVTGSFWFAAAPMAAGLATLKRVRETGYLEHIIRIGALLREGLSAEAKAAGFALHQTGPAQMPQVLFPEDPDFRLGFRFAEHMLARGIYWHPWHNMFVCAAHTEADVAQTLEAARESFAILARERETLPPNAKMRR